MRTKVKSLYLVAYENNDHVIYQNGELVYDDETIVFAGSHFDGSVDKVINAGNSIVSPGFVDLNALADIDTTVMDYDQPFSLADSQDWSVEYIQKGPHEIASEEDEQFKYRYALTQLVLNGITTALPVTGLQYKSWAETAREFNGVKDSAVKLGLRVYLGPSYRSSVHTIDRNGYQTRFWNDEKGFKGLDDAVSFIEKNGNTGNGLVNGLLVPSTIETCSTELLRRTKKYADELHVPVRLHAAQSKRENRLIHEDHGCSPITFLNRIGFLSQTTIIPHGIYIDRDEGGNPCDYGDMEILRDTGTVLAYCPFAVARSGEIMDSYEKYLRNGLRIGMGTDCYPCDMLMNMRLGSLLCRFVDRTPNSAKTADIYRTATIGGADALGRKDLGRLAKGCKADFFILSLDGIHTGQVDDPIRTMVWYCNNTDIKTVVINGKTVMNERQIDGVDMKAYQRRAQEYYDRYKESYTERDRFHRDKSVIFPGCYKLIP